MRKLIAMLAVCAGAMGLHAATTGTSFEGLIPGGETSIDYVDAFETSGSELDTTQTPGAYWDVNGTSDYAFDEGGFVITTTNQDGTTACSSIAGGRHSQFSGDANIGFLAIETKKGESVTRYANPTNESGVHEAVAIDNESSYYFDSLIQFTPFETNKFASEVLVGDSKLAIWLQAGEIDPVSLDPVATQLVVSAGYLIDGDALTTTNYLCKVDDIDIFDGGWHRVTVKEFGSIYNSSNVRTPAFAIAIDGNPVYKTNDCRYAGLNKSKYSSRALNFEYSSESSFEDLKYNGPILFPSAVRGTESSMSSVSFQGVGAVDDLVFSENTDREWMQDDMFTIELGANVTNAVYSVNGGTPVQIAADTQIPYSSGMAVTISDIGYTDGYMKLGCGPAVSGVLIVTNDNDSSYVVTVSAANKTVTIDAQAIGATIVDSSVTPVVTPCATPAAAFALISAESAGTGPFTVTLAADADNGVTLVGDYDVILDLAGKKLSAGGDDLSAIYVGDANDNGESLTIIDTVGGGVVNGSSNDVAAVTVDAGTLIIDGGTYEGFVNADPDNGNVFTVTGEGVKFTKADIDDNDTYDYTLAAVVAGLGSDYELGVDGDYYVVQEATPAPTTATVTFDVDGDTSAIASQTVDIGDCATEPSPAPSKDGYTFDCWKLNDVEFDFSTAITEDITLVAAWTINTYDVTFTTNGVAYVVQNKDYNTKATKPADPVGFAGKEFKSWQQEGHATDYDFDTLVTSNFTIVATWSNAIYTVTYNLDLAGATNAVDNIPTYTVDNATFTLLDAGCDGYTFNGWTNDVGTTVTTIAGGATGDITLYASWTAAGGGGLDPESGVTNVTVTTASAAAAETAAKAEITVPAGSGADQGEYADYFKYGVENIGENTYEVSITGIVETVETGVAASAVQRLTDSEATAITIPPGLYYRITPSTVLPISGTPQTGLSSGSVTIGKPGTDKGFYKIELNATSLAD